MNGSPSAPVVDVDHARDVLGLQLRAGARLEQEPRLRLAVGDVLIEELHRDVLIEQLVVSRHHDAHPASPRMRSTRYFPASRSPTLSSAVPAFGLARFRAVRSGERGRHTPEA